MSIEYFGNGRQLLGALHVPQRLQARRTAVVLCNPFGEEASRSHRTYRVLATQLEHAGYACLRFDYSGTGDSLGESGTATIDAWVRDVGVAAERVRVASGADRVVVVGLRFGATLAVLAAARGVIKPRHLLLWDPVVSGTSYLRELLTQHRAYMRDELGEHWTDHQHVVRDVPTEVLGAPIGAALGAELTALELDAIVTGAEPVTVVSTRSTPELAAFVGKLHAATKWLQLTETVAWNSDAALNAMTVPMEIVQALVARIEEVSP